MLLTPCPNPVIEPDIISEPKLDGHRMILNHSSGIPKFYTRHGNELFQYPELNSVLSAMMLLLMGKWFVTKTIRLTLNY